MSNQVYHNQGNGQVRFENGQYVRRPIEDWQRPGPHTGKGPAVRRSDQRILETLNERLTRHGEIDARDVQVAVRDGVVTLGGRVFSRKQKWLAEMVAGDVPGVREVDNRLQVIKGWIETPHPHQPASVGQDNEPARENSA